MPLYCLRVFMLPPRPRLSSRAVRGGQLLVQLPVSESSRSQQELAALPGVRQHAQGGTRYALDIICKALLRLVDAGDREIHHILRLY
jgi:hypothetical protein